MANFYGSAIGFGGGGGAGLGAPYDLHFLVVAGGGPTNQGMAGGAGAGGGGAGRPGRDDGALEQGVDIRRREVRDAGNISDECKARGGEELLPHCAGRPHGQRHARDRRALLEGAGREHSGRE